MKTDFKGFLKKARYETHAAAQTTRIRGRPHDASTQPDHQLKSGSITGGRSLQPYDEFQLEELVGRGTSFFGSTSGSQPGGYIGK